MCVCVSGEEQRVRALPRGVRGAERHEEPQRARGRGAARAPETGPERAARARQQPAPLTRGHVTLEPTRASALSHVCLRDQTGTPRCRWCGGAEHTHEQSTNYYI